MNCVILQPSYIPWRGYFHQIAKADVFVFLDDVQYDKRGWRNRNQIKTPHGLQWLTIPVHSKGAQTNNVPINDIRIVWEKEWNREHLETIFHAYKKAPYFETFYPMLQEWLAPPYELLADLTIETSIQLARYLGITNTRFLRSSAMPVDGVKTERLIHLIEKVGADHYISGPSARDYIEESVFRSHGVSLEYMQYDYPPYPQLYSPFEANVSIIDLIFMTGENALEYILSEPA